MSESVMVAVRCRPFNKRFAYGQTGSGKSYSMVGYGEDKGIVPQAMEEMFTRIKANKDKNIKYSVEASMMEIYNEKVKDLFNPDPSAGGVNGLKVRDSPQTGPYVEGLSRSILTSFKEFEHLLSEGNAVRTVAATQMNATSSRAHTVFQIIFTTTTHDEETNKSSAKTSKINLVDLAGSERLAKCWGRGTELRMFDGSVRKVEDIREGDVLIGDDSLPRVVRAGSLVHRSTADDAADVASGRIVLREGECAPATYRITSSSAARQSWTCNGGHILVLCMQEAPVVAMHRGRWGVQVWELAQNERGIISPRRTWLPQHFAASESGRRAAQKLQRDWMLAHPQPAVWHITVEEYARLYSAEQQRVSKMFTPELTSFAPLVDSQKQPRSLQARLTTLLLSQPTEELQALTAWVLGVWSARGGKSLSLSDEEQADLRVARKLQQWNELVCESVQDAASKDQPDSVLRNLLLTYKLSADAPLPQDLLREDITIRSALLSGVLDASAQDTKTDSTMLHSGSKDFLLSVSSLALSLGHSAGAISKSDLLGFELAISASPESSSRAACFTVERVAHVEYFGFSVDGPSGRLLMGDFVVTHNTGASGQQMKEGIGINKSLTALGNCIEKLAKKSSVKKGAPEVHVPYRDSVLTYLLKESLGGNAKTIMIAAVSPADDNYDESLSTLRYADRAKQIKNSAVVNEDENGRMIRELKKEIQALRDALAKGGGGAGGPAAHSGMSDAEKEEYEALKAQMKQNEDLVARMNMSWEEKMKESEELAFKRAQALNTSSDVLEKKKKLPHMVNLHKDKLMSECLSYFFIPGSIRLCTKSADPPPTEDDIVLSGLQIKPEHAVAEYNDKTRELFLTPGEGARVFLNGKLLKERTQLSHNDRLICGAHLVFKVLFPNHAADDGESMFDWEYANKELTSQTIEALNKPDEETLRAQKEQQEKMEKMQKEMEAERLRAKADQEARQREYENTLKEIAQKKADEIAETKKQIEQASHADSVKLSKKLAEREAELERERAQAAKQHSDRLESMKKEALALEQKLAAQQAEMKGLHKKHEVEKRDRQLLEENLMHCIPMVNEANAICTELGQALRYSIKLEAKRSLDDDGFTERTDVWIRVLNLEDDMEVLWDMDTLQEALYLMREIYNNYMRSGEIDIPENKEENPFHLQPNGPMLIGTARLYLQPCFFLLPINESTAIIDYKGEHKGQLYVNLIPIPPRDEDTMNLKEDELFFEEEELTELKGEPLSMRLEVKKCMGLPQKYSSKVFVSYKFFYDDKEHKCEPSADVSINPLLNYERTLLVDIVEDAFVEYVKSGILEFSVFGEQIIEEKSPDANGAESGTASFKGKSKRGSIKGGGGKKDGAGSSSSSSSGGDGGARLAKLEAVLRDITEQVVVPGSDDASTLLTQSPEVISAKVKQLKVKAANLEEEVTVLKSPEKARKGGASDVDSQTAAENAKLKAELESLRRKPGGGSTTASVKGSGLFPDAEAAAAEAAALRAELEALKVSSPSPAVLDENASLKAALASLKSKATPAAAELSDLRAAAASSKSAMATLREELARKEAEAAELRELKDKEAAINRELADKLATRSVSHAGASAGGPNEEEVASLRRELESARAKVAKATPSSDQSAEVEELKRQLAEAKKKSTTCTIL